MSHGTFGRARHRQSGPGAISTVTAVGPTGRARHRREGPPGVVPVPAGVLLPGTPPQVRWREGQRLEGLFEATCDALAASGLADRLAVDGKALSLTYGQLDERANR
ncbi:hypothetical protein HER39_16345, partial [Arthrobacter deserti]|nr:hypothetical protein [Arthrobacter deserti]